MSHDEATLDSLDDEINQEVARFRGERLLPMRRRSPQLGVTELLLGGAAVGILLLFLFALVVAMSNARRPGRMRFR